MKTTLDWSFDLDAMMTRKSHMLLMVTDPERTDWGIIPAMVKSDDMGKQLVDTVMGMPILLDVYAWAIPTMPTPHDAASYFERLRGVGRAVA